jgi:hypothetical protein
VVHARVHGGAFSLQPHPFRAVDPPRQQRNHHHRRAGNGPAAATGRLDLENLALRQQLLVYKRTANRPQLRRRDRLFWVWAVQGVGRWRQVLVIVAPDTALRWPRRRFRDHWTKLSNGSVSDPDKVLAKDRERIRGSRMYLRHTTPTEGRQGPHLLATHLLATRALRPRWTDGAPADGRAPG